MAFIIVIWAALLSTVVIALCRKSTLRTVQFVLDIRRRAKALSELPGPSYG